MTTTLREPRRKIFIPGKKEFVFCTYCILLVGITSVILAFCLIFRARDDVQDGEMYDRSAWCRSGSFGRMRIRIRIIWPYAYPDLDSTSFKERCFIFTSRHPVSTGMQSKASIL